MLRSQNKKGAQHDSKKHEQGGGPDLLGERVHGHVHRLVPRRVDPALDQDLAKGQEGPARRAGGVGGRRGARAGGEARVGRRERSRSGRGAREGRGRGQRPFGGCACCAAAHVARLAELDVLARACLQRGAREEARADPTLALRLARGRRAGRAARTRRSGFGGRRRQRERLEDELQLGDHAARERAERARRTERQARRQPAAVAARAGAGVEVARGADLRAAVVRARARREEGELRRRVDRLQQL